MPVDVRPLTPELWPDFETLFGKAGACFGCWCTYFRLHPAARRATGDSDKRQIMRDRVAAGPPPGLLAFDGGQAVGWMQVGPRADVPEWNGGRRASAPLEEGDAADPGVWAVTCFFSHKAARGRGMSHSLVEAGIVFARDAGARALEACPIRQSQDTSRMGLFVGSARVFERAGFRVVAERRPGRPLMRLDL
jgi:GNAT superfamily N-acetyltransferase